MQSNYIPVVERSQIETLARVANVVWHEYFPFLLSADQIDYMVQKFQSAAAIEDQIAKGYDYFLIQSDGEIVGYVGLCPEQDGVFLSKLYILAQYRGRGHASQAFDMIRSYAQSRGFSRVRLTCNKHNTHSLDVYRKKGFVTVSDEITDIGNGYVMDDYVMVLDLDRQ